MRESVTGKTSKCDSYYIFLLIVLVFILELFLVVYIIIYPSKQFASLVDISKIKLDGVGR